MSRNWRESEEQFRFPGNLMKRELQNPPESGAKKRPRVGPDPQIHEVISAVMKKSRADLKSGFPSCVPPFQALTYLQNNHVQYSQSDDLQLIINKMVEIEQKLECITPKREEAHEQTHRQELLAQIQRLLSQIDARHSTTVRPNELESMKTYVDRLLNACNPSSRGVAAENGANSIQELLRKINTSIAPFANQPEITAPRRPAARKRSPTEKRKLDSASDFEPMMEDSDIDVSLNRPMLQPRKIVFAFQPQNSMDVE